MIWAGATPVTDSLIPMYELNPGSLYPYEWLHGSASPGALGLTFSHDQVG